MWNIVIIILLVIVFVLYVIADNRRLKVRKQEINCGSSDKIKILQVSDLHSRVFRNADYLLINSLEYDVIAFTGDTFNPDDREYIAIKEFMKNVKNVKKVLYVDGNNGTKAYDKNTNELTKFGKELEKLGIIVIKDKYEINDVVFTNYNILTSKLVDEEVHGRYKAYEALNKEMRMYKKFNVGLAHYPLDKYAINLVNQTNRYYVPSVVLAGHYHGGQLRLPLIGAVVIFNHRSKIGFTFFPKQKLVSGYYEKGKVKQYISRGVGVSKHFKLLAFRLFNTPEIDLIEISF